MNYNKKLFWWFLKYLVICLFSLVAGILILCNTKSNMPIFIASLFLSVGILGLFLLFHVYNSMSDDIKESENAVINNRNCSLINTTEETNVIIKAYDPLFLDVVAFLIQGDIASVSMIQRKFSIGINRATRLLGQLAEAGVIDSGTSSSRKLLIHNNEEWQVLKTELIHKLSKPKYVSKEIPSKKVSNKIELFLSEEMYNIVKDASESLCDYIIDVTKHRCVREKLDNLLKIKDSNGNPFDTSTKVDLVVAADAYRCYKGFGYDFATDNECDLGILLFMIKYTAPKITVQFQNYYTYRLKLKESYTSYLENALNIVSNNIETLPNEFVMQKILGEFDKDLQIHYMTLIYLFASAIANTDRQVGDTETKWLSDILKSRENVIKNGGNNENVLNQNSYSIESPYQMLEDLIGLSSVKDEIINLTNFIKIQQVRKSKGLKSPEISLHCVFTGNPGTGKTTVARIMASIYKDLGLLKKGHLIETDRSGLVAEYMGQTAVKTNKIIDSALDGVLFIDEAYSLVQGSGNDYGHEAISTLLKRMEDERNRLVVILAGYSSEMKGFIDSNPGLQSRFNRYIHFSDYSADELKQIFLLNAKKNQYTLDDEATSVLEKMMFSAIEHKDKNFGNARFVRNLFEKSIQNQATRLSSISNITEEALSMLKAEDFQI